MKRILIVLFSGIILSTNLWASGMSKQRTSTSGSGTPGGSNTQVQYNNSSSFAGDSGLTYESTADDLTVGTTASGRILIPSTTGASATGGLLFGADANIYRDGAGTLKTDGQMTIPTIVTNTEVYDATGWNGDLTVPTKDAVRDKFEALSITSPFTTTSNVTFMNTSTDNVNIGNSTDRGKFTVEGDTDEVQGNFIGHSTQTNNILRVGKKDGTNLFTISNDGTMIASGTGTEAATFGSGNQATYVTTYNLSGTDFTATASSGTMTYSGALASTTFDTGQGANELYDMDQNVLTTSSPTFVDTTVTTEAYDATGWNGDNTVPTKDAVRDKIETISAGAGNTFFQGVDFDASNDIISIDSGSTIDNNFSSTVTFSACIEPDSRGEEPAGNGVVYSKTNADCSDNGFCIVTEGTTTSTPRMSIFHHTSGTQLYRGCADTITPGARTNIILSGDGGVTQSNWTWLYNNTACSSYVAGSNGTGSMDSDAASYGQIGGVTDGTLTFDGRISQVGVWTRALSSDERAILNRACASDDIKLFESVSPAKAAFLLPLNECGDGEACTTANMFKDRTVNGNNGTPSNSPTGYVDQS